MRILHVVPTYLPATRYGGPIYSVHALARAQVRRGAEVHVFTTNVDGSSVSPVPLGVPVDRDGVEISYFPCGVGRRLYRAPAMTRALTAHVTQFDIVHLHSVFLWPTFSGARAARAARIPYILSPRGMLVADLIRRKSSLIKQAWIELFEKANIENAAAVHVTSRVEAAEIAALGLLPRHVALVPNGVDLPPIYDNTPTNDKPIILSLGRINWKKGLDRLIRAMTYIPDAELVIAGNDEEGFGRELREITCATGVAERVRFIGPVYGEDKWTLMRSASVFAMPSYSENFGIAVLEAMACAVPVVVTREVGLAETVREVGAGDVVQGEPQVIGPAIARLLANPAQRRAMGAAGRKVAEKRFSWDKIANQMETVYRHQLT